MEDIKARQERQAVICAQRGNILFTMATRSFYFVCHILFYFHVFSFVLLAKHRLGGGGRDEGM